MPGQRRGADGAGNPAFAARMAELERMVLELRGGVAPAAAGGGAGTAGDGSGGKRRSDSRGGARGPRGAAGSGGGGGAGGSGSGDGTTRSRPGDWRCPSCGFFPCFSRTSRCFKCGAARPDGGGGGSFLGAAAAAPRHPAGGRLTGTSSTSTYLGPVGAGGSRPLLGRRDPPAPRPVDTCPTVRVPGASAAAEAEERRRRAQETDSEGFRPVRNGAAAAGHGNVAAAARAAERLGGGPPTTTRNSWAAISERDDMDDDDDDGDGDAQQSGQSIGSDGTTGGAGGREPPPSDDGTEAREEGMDAEHCDGGEEEVDAGQLKAEWLAHGAAVRKLEKDLMQAPINLRNSLLSEARAHRDAAEARWRAARTPPPLSRRLKWAELELRDAESKERARRLELERHLEETASRTRDLEQRLSIDVARTARKRAAIEALHGEGAAVRPQWSCSTSSAARVAATGIAMDVAPTLTSVIEKLGTPSGDDLETLKQELELCAVSLSRVEGVLRDASASERAGGGGGGGGPACFDIGDGPPHGTVTHGGGGGRCDDQAGGDGGGPTQHLAATAARWSRPAPNKPWKKLAMAPSSVVSSSSASAAEEARRILADSVRGDGGATRPGANVAGTAAVGGSGPEQPQRGLATAPLASADTNDLAEAARRDRLAACQQVLQVQRDQQRRHDDQRRQQEEAERLQREALQKEELERHQLEMQRAATARAEDEARERAELLAKLSPQERARAEEAHALLTAVGSHAFGTQAASEAAGLAHQHHVRERTLEAARAGEAVVVDELLAMSPEEFAKWEGERHGPGAVPW